MNEFYLADETHPKVGGGNIVLKGLLYFRCPKAGYDGKANKEHIKNYVSEFLNFKAKNPDYVLAPNLEEGEVGQPSFGLVSHAPSEAPKVEAPKAPEVRKDESPGKVK